MQKVKKGHKFCAGCQEQLPLASFPASKALCKKDYNACRNLQAHAKATNQLEWFEKTRNDPSSFARLLRSYHARTQAPGKKYAKRCAFPIAEYREEISQEESLQAQGVFEMMHLRRFIHWAGKPGNQGLEAEDAVIEWKRLCELPDATLDFLGPTEKYAKRVAVRVKDLIVHTNEQRKRKAMALSEGPKKKNKIRRCRKKKHKQVESGTLRFTPGAELSVADTKKHLATRTAASRASGQYNMFCEAGITAGLLDGIDKEVEESDACETEPNESGYEEQGEPKPSGSGKRKGQGKGKTKQSKAFNRDQALTQVRTYNEWASNAALGVQKCMIALTDCKERTTDKDRASVVEDGNCVKCVCIASS